MDIIGAARELLGSGTLLGYTVLGEWYEPAALMLLPPSAFFLIGFLIWGIRAYATTQTEEREFTVPAMANRVEDAR